MLRHNTTISLSAVSTNIVAKIQPFLKLPKKNMKKMFFLIKVLSNHLIFVFLQTEKIGPGFGFDSKDNGFVSMQADAPEALTTDAKR
mgnify:CR=1 FL=1